MIQTCCVCKLEKDLSFFYNDTSKKYGKSTTCKLCARARADVWAVKNRERMRVAKQTYHRAHRREHQVNHWRKYGINFTQEQYMALLAVQNGRCAICVRPADSFKKALAPDHNHLTGEVRGLLCGNCNLGIGHFKDSPELLNRTIAYLEQTCHAK